MSYVNGSSTSGTGTTYNLAPPAGATLDDVLLAFHSNDAGTYAGMSSSMGTPYGGYDGGASGVHSRCYARTIDGTEPGTYSFTSSVSSESAIVMALLRGVTLTGADSSFTSDPSGNNQWICPSLSPATGDGDLLCYVGYGTDNVGNTFTPPSGMTERFDLQSSVWISTSLATLSNPGTPTGTRTFTSTQTASWASNGSVFSIYLPLITGGPGYNPPTDIPPNIPVSPASVATPLVASSTPPWSIDV